MAYQFPPDVEELVRRQMQSGEFASEEEVLREALRVLEQSRDNLRVEKTAASPTTGSVFDLFGKAPRFRTGEEIAEQLQAERKSWDDV